ncbi:MAG: translation elongation factor 4 [Elusimicrobiota bacterium]|nr:translation elongation factor 4 [Elusimicrobiota bacterium]
MKNFTVIAHIDHGKSTLCDRVLELTGDLIKGGHQDLILDSMPLERERGITIKAKAVRITYKGEILNMVDTPGHVDFSYEVSRSLSSCEAAVLVVDASQGIEAQTVANLENAKKNNLHIIPVLNKIDLPAARPQEVEKELQALLETTEEILKVSAKTGEGVEELLDKIVRETPEPLSLTGNKPSAIVFDSVFDPYKGAIAYIKVTGGEFKAGQKIRFFSSTANYEIKEIGYFGVEKVHSVKKLKDGEIGYLITGMKDLKNLKIGDTLTLKDRGIKEPLRGYREPKQFVFAGLYPVENAEYPKLKKALDKLQINDTSFTYHPEDSPSLGPGFRCGFLGILHMEIIKGRLEDEYGIDIVITRPQVEYIVDGKHIDSPIDFPSAGYDAVREPYVECTVITPADYMGAVFELFETSCGTYVEMKYINPQRVILKYELPLREMVEEFYGQLKSSSRGYATLDYRHIGYLQSKLVKLQIMVNNEEIEGFSSIMTEEEAKRKGVEILRTLKKSIPKHQFKIPLQAKVGKNITARMDIPALRKNVTAGLYGGDITRKRKVLEKQKKGKKKMKMIGSVSIPPDVFMQVKSYGD